MASLAQDFLAGRQNVIPTAKFDELNGKLGAIAQVFGLDWLEEEGSHSLQLLWKRKDALATIELLNFGDAVERLFGESLEWLKGQAEIIKSGDLGNSQGAIFEILALSMFSRKSCKVIPAPENMPGFDGTLVLDDGARVLVSIKNHGLSSHEREFRDAAKDFDDHFQQGLAHHGLYDTEIRVISPEPMTWTVWEALKRDTDMCLTQFASGQAGGAINGPYDIVLKPIDAIYQPTSTFFRSSSCFVAAPHHRNEQKKFVEDIRKGCANLLKHTKNIEGEVCRLVLLRLSVTASIHECQDWAAWYFSEYPDDPLDVIVLYQSTLVTDHAADTSSIAHYIIPIAGPNFAKWQKSALGHVRRLPGISVLIGEIVIDQPSMILTDGSVSVDMSRYYTYQRADIYRRLDISGGSTEGVLSNPAPGVMVHLVVEQNGQVVRCIKMNAREDKALTLLP